MMICALLELFRIRNHMKVEELENIRFYLGILLFKIGIEEI